MNFLNHIHSKIFDSHSLEKALALWRFQNEKIVFTNGCFDLIHSGHLQYLAQARALGNRLIIGLNSDISTQRLKGKHRPINDEKSRGLLLASLIFVDGIIVFEEETPLELIKKIQPDVLVKGGDYMIENIVGAKEVQEKGGLVTTISFLEGYSTTNIETKILNNHK